MRDEHYIRASEVNAFVYCRRAWYLARRNASSSRQKERDDGTAYHLRHGDRARGAARAGRLAWWCGAAGILLAAAAVGAFLW